MSTSYLFASRVGPAITSFIAYTTSGLLGAVLAARALGVRPISFVVARRDP